MLEVGHERRYERDSLDRLLRATGYRVHELRYVNPVGALGWFVSARLLRRKGLPLWTLGPYDRLVPLLRPLDRFDLPVGLSVWAVAERV